MSDLSFTHIYEGARAALNLSRDKYALCNYIQTWSTYPGRCPGFCDRTQAQMAEFIGITDRGVRKMLQSLEAEDLIEKHPTNGLCRITKKWFNTVALEKKKEEQSSASTGTKFLIGRNKVPHQQEQSSAHKEKLKEVKEEKDIYTQPAKTENEPQPPKSQKIETADEAKAAIAAWLNDGNEETVKLWYSELKINYDRGEFKTVLIKFCSNYMTSSDEGFVQRFQKDPVKFFRNRFQIFLPTCRGFDVKQSTKPAPSQSRAVYTPPAKRF